MPSHGGVYTVISEVPVFKEIKFGKRKSHPFNKGFYAYVGSALNGLERRLKRHLGNRKKMHWHIDYLLESAIVRDAILSETTENLECSIADSLAGTLPAVPSFGCGDCRCNSHLFYCSDINIIVAQIMNGFNKHNLIIRRMASDPDGWYR